MAYADVTVIVGGAFDSEETFTDQTLLNARIEEIREDASSDGMPTEVYIVHHEHEQSEDECACVQYLNDHKPAYVFNV